MMRYSMGEGLPRTDQSSRDNWFLWVTWLGLWECCTTEQQVAFCLAIQICYVCVVLRLVCVWECMCIERCHSGWIVCSLHVDWWLKRMDYENWRLHSFSITNREILEIAISFLQYILDCGQSGRDLLLCSCCPQPWFNTEHSFWCILMSRSLYFCCEYDHRTKQAIINRSFC